MTADATKLVDWLVIISDHENVGRERLAGREAHLQGLVPHIASGFWTMGGALLKAPEEGQGQVVNGSCLVANATTKEEVIAKLQADIYYNGVWNLEKVQIFPLAIAFRKEKTDGLL
ncbi:hypothetical protein VE01_10843 [Pseudogymnoascus verrucosus]|uniref:YCII-related domain-containing protein n=1 Tax=Pseudogymnoascus verrucosus TaxID=342668 RepID=A0A2P6FH31_9PEZI|nr:uncharacterized protein VE01_10843 [Pseudogymnoascus verrucosus]PQM43947.1 hypothetical protein VE01_10843 [Pseudogymnoascus verrucosus]